jgi:hypothetical protein
MSPARSSTFTCFETAFSDRGNRLAISVMVAGFRRNDIKMARRVGSATAPKTRSSAAE